jgi:hypothetical protein
VRIGCTALGRVSRTQVGFCLPAKEPGEQCALERHVVVCDACVHRLGGYWTGPRVI